MAELEGGRAVLWEAIAVTWLKGLRARNGAAAVGEMTISEVEWAHWQIGTRLASGEGEEGKEGEGSVEGT